MKRILFFITFSSILLAGCETGKDETQERRVTINIHDSQDVGIADFIDSVRFIRLQTLDESLINYINRVYFINDKIIAVDPLQSQIFFFDREGNFLHRIKKTGQGPGEYMGITASLLDPVRETVMIYSASLNKMVFYGLDGTFVKEITGFSDNALIRSIINLPDGHFLCYTHDLLPKDVGEHSGLWEVDSDGKFVRSFFVLQELYPVQYNVDNSPFTLLPDGGIGLQDAQFNSIFHYRGDSLTKYLSYEIENDKLLEYKGLTYTKEKYTKGMTSQDKGDYIFTKWMDGEAWFYTVYSKKNDHATLVYPSKKFWTSNRVAEANAHNFIDSNLSGVLVTSITGTAIPDIMANENASPDIKEKLQKIVHGMNREEIKEMNPVLQLLYVKPQGR